MKKADKNLDYKINSSTIFDEPTQLVVTKSGQYVIPINPLKGILNHVKKRNHYKHGLVNNRKQQLEKRYLFKNSVTVCTSIDRHIVKNAYLSWKPMANRQVIKKKEKKRQ